MRYEVVRYEVVRYEVCGDVNVRGGGVDGLGAWNKRLELEL